MAPGKWDAAGAGVWWTGGRHPLRLHCPVATLRAVKRLRREGHPARGAPALTTVLLTALVGAA